jgi:hypothetical protein
MLGKKKAGRRCGHLRSTLMSFVMKSVAAGSRSGRKSSAKQTD